MRARSPQTLSEADRRLVAAWAADCVERVQLRIVPDDASIQEMLARVRAFSRCELNTADEIRRRFQGASGESANDSPAAKAAFHGAAQAVAISHMGAYALGAAAYAVRAVCLASPVSLI